MAETRRHRRERVDDEVAGLVESTWQLSLRITASDATP
jgi:hypothetical protein